MRRENLRTSWVLGLAKPLFSQGTKYEQIDWKLKRNLLEHFQNKIFGLFINLLIIWNDQIFENNNKSEMVQPRDISLDKATPIIKICDKKKRFIWLRVIRMKRCKDENVT